MKIKKPKRRDYSWALRQVGRLTHTSWPNAWIDFDLGIDNNGKLPDLDYKGFAMQPMYRHGWSKVPAEATRITKDAEGIRFELDMSKWDESEGAAIQEPTPAEKPAPEPEYVEHVIDWRESNNYAGTPGFANDMPLEDWYADKYFAGYKFRHPNGAVIHCADRVIWVIPVDGGGWLNQPTESHTLMLTPTHVAELREVAK